VQAAQCGICISPEEPAELAQAIQKLHGDAELRKRLGSNGRQYILEHFCRKQLSRKYTGVLNAVLERKSPHPLPATEEHRQDPV
jgi:glycosyltransferase involved in cell wall biosynthesis